MKDDDIQLHSYQDDLTTDEDATDPLMDESDDPTKELGVPAEEFGDEMDKQDFGDHLDKGDDDRRENLEDLDEDADDESYR